MVLALAVRVWLCSVSKCHVLRLPALQEHSDHTLHCILHLHAMFDYTDRMNCEDPKPEKGNPSRHRGSQKSRDLQTVQKGLQSFQNCILPYMTLCLVGATWIYLARPSLTLARERVCDLLELQAVVHGVRICLETRGGHA
jgi:hypothetical protein